MDDPIKSNNSSSLICVILCFLAFAILDSPGSSPTTKYVVFELGALVTRLYVLFIYIFHKKQ